MAGPEIMESKGVGLAKRKWWGDFTDSEKIEKLKKELVRAEKHIARLSKFIEKLSNHEHLDGKLVSRIHGPNEESYGGFDFRVEEFDD